MNKSKGIFAALGGMGLIIGVSIVAILTAMLVINGLTWIARVVFPLTIWLTQIALAIFIFILLPLSFIRRTYDFSAIGILIVSYVVGASIWIVAFMETYRLWGTWGLVIGLVFMGIGVVPIAILAMLFHGMWAQSAQLVIAALIVIAIQAYSFHVGSKTTKALR